MVTLQILVLPFLVRVRVAQRSFVCDRECRVVPEQRRTYRLGYGVMVTLQILVLPFLVRVRVAQQRDSAFPCPRVSGIFFLRHDAGQFATRRRTACNTMQNSLRHVTGRTDTKKEGAIHLLPSVSLPQKVGMTRLELATSRPPDVCATNCATSRSLSLRVQRYDFFLLLPNFFVTLFAET